MEGSKIGLCFPIRRMAIREARRPRGGAVILEDVGEGMGRIVVRAW